MKKKILFVIESLDSGGAEKSLVSLLSLLDYSKYDVDLQLFSYNGAFQELVPKDVNILKELPYFEACRKPITSLVISDPSKAICRIKYSLMIRTRKLSHPQKAILFWKNTQKCFSKNPKHYDVAIAYAQGTPTFYVADCITADMKYAWVNVTYKPEGKWREYVSSYYEKYDKVNCVSLSAKEIFEIHFPEHKEKTVLIYDINNYELIANMADLPSAAKDDMNFDGIKLLTVGRLAPQKGYEIAVDTCKILKDRGISFRWYVLGKGDLEEEIKDHIHRNGLDGIFVLLGTKKNPYPYFKRADIYVQTSKYEGFGLAIAEARMLNIPVITTRFDAVYDQMIDEKNGLVVDMNAEAVADGVQRLIEDPVLYQQIKEYQNGEKKGNTEEINKFNELLK